MMLSGHLLVATGCFLAFKEYSTQGQWYPDTSLLIEYALIVLGCLLPDIDHTESTIGRRFKVLSLPISLVFGHRGAFHSLLSTGLIVYCAYYFQIPWLNWLAGGYLLHLLGDYLTPSGVPLFYPSRKRYRFPIVTSTNSISEYFVSIGFFASGVYYALIA